MRVQSCLFAVVGLVTACGGVPSEADSLESGYTVTKTAPTTTLSCGASQVEFAGACHGSGWFQRHLATGDLLDVQSCSTLGYSDCAIVLSELTSTKESSSQVEGTVSTYFLSTTTCTSGKACHNGYVEVARFDATYVGATDGSEWSGEIKMYFATTTTPKTKSVVGSQIAYAGKFIFTENSGGTTWSTISNKGSLLASGLVAASSSSSGSASFGQILCQTSAEETGKWGGTLAGAGAGIVAGNAIVGAAAALLIASTPLTDGTALPATVTIFNASLAARIALAGGGAFVGGIVGKSAAKWLAQSYCPAIEDAVTGGDSPTIPSPGNNPPGGVSGSTGDGFDCPNGTYRLVAYTTQIDSSGCPMDCVTTTHYFCSGVEDADGECACEQQGNAEEVCSYGADARSSDACTF